MARLPTPGGDDGSWGDILNDFLNQSHNSDGTLKNSAIDGIQGQPISTATPADNDVLTYNSGAGQWEPASVGSAVVPDATAVTKGILQLTGDLGGTASLPTVPGLANKQPLDVELTEIAGLTPSNDDLLQRKGGTWTNRTPAQVKADMGLGNVPNVDATNRANHTGTQTASTISDFSEAVDDRVGTLLVEGAGIDLTYDDIGNSLTIAAAGGGYSDEQAQDAVGTILVDTSTINFTYADATPSIIADVIDGSITYAKMQDVSTTDRLLGRSSPGAGDVEEIPLTAAGRALIDDADTTAQRATLGLTPGTDVQAFDADLSALAGIGTNGILVHTGAGTATTRTITGTANRITVANGDGVAGNPTIDIGTDVVTLTGTQTLTNKTIDGSLNTITNISMDHGALTGLTPDDDHPQYALLDGRSSGQILIGGTANADNLTLNANTQVWDSTDKTGQVVVANSRMRFTGQTSVDNGSVIGLISFTETVSVAGASIWGLSGFNFAPTFQQNTSFVVGTAPAFAAAANMNVTVGGISDSSNYLLGGFLSNGQHRVAHSGAAGTTGLYADYIAQSRFIRASGTGTHTITDSAGFLAWYPRFIENHVNTGYTVTNIRGFWARSPNNSGGTITNSYGLDVDALTTGATANTGVRIAHPALGTSLGTSTDSIGLAIPTSSVVMGNQTATLTNKHGISVGIATMTSTTNTRTITNSASVFIAGAPVASTNVAVTNGPYALWVNAGTARFDGRIVGNQGADVPSANDLTLGADGNVFEITGTNQINAITTTGWQKVSQYGPTVTLLFTSTPTVKHNTAGGANTAIILLAGAVDFVASAGDTLTLVLSEIGGAVAWREVGRAVI